jgi:zinc transporter 1/2/3
MAVYRFTSIPEMDTESFHHLLARDEAESPPPCITEQEYDGGMGLWGSSIFVILVGSILGAVFPIVHGRPDLA